MRLARAAAAGALPAVAAVALLLAAPLAGGCRHHAGPQRPVLEARNAPVSEVLSTLAARTGRAVVIDPSAAGGAEYARVTVLVPGGVDDETLARLLSTALAGSGLVVAVTQDGWVVRRAAAAGGPQTTLVAGAAPAADGGVDALVARLAEGVHQRGPAEYELTVATRDAVVDNFEQLLQTVRTMPYERGGRVTGIQVFFPSSHPLMSRLGLQNGDVVRSINGQDVASPDRALEVYSQARRTASWTVELVRDGTQMQQQYHLALQ